MEVSEHNIKNDEPNRSQEEGVMWFYEDNGSRKGGISENEIISLIEKGKITYGTSVWKAELPDWLNVEDTELHKHLSKISPPPLKGDKVNNTVVWVLAFAPLIGLFIEGFVAGIIYGNSYRVDSAISNAEFWYVTVILNIALSILDERKIKSAGQDTSRFKGWVFLVPVYLYQRAKILNQNISYFVVWIICFAIMMFT